MSLFQYHSEPMFCSPALMFTTSPSVNSRATKSASPSTAFTGFSFKFATLDNDIVALE